MSDRRKTGGRTAGALNYATVLRQRGNLGMTLHCAEEIWTAAPADFRVESTAALMEKTIVRYVYRGADPEAIRDGVMAYMRRTGATVRPAHTLIQREVWKASAASAPKARRLLNVNIDEALEVTDRIFEIVPARVLTYGSKEKAFKAVLRAMRAGDSADQILLGLSAYYAHPQQTKEDAKYAAAIYNALTYGYHLSDGGRPRTYQRSLPLRAKPQRLKLVADPTPPPAPVADLFSDITDEPAPGPALAEPPPKKRGLLARLFRRGSAQ